MILWDLRPFFFPFESQRNKDSCDTDLKRMAFLGNQEPAFFVAHEALTFSASDLHLSQFSTIPGLPPRSLPFRGSGVNGGLKYR